MLYILKVTKRGVTMNAQAGINTVNTFTQYLLSNEISKAIETIKGLKSYDYETKKVLLMIPVNTANHIQNLIHERAHPPHLQELIDALKRQLPNFYPVQMSEFLYHFGIAHDYVRAYVIMTYILKLHPQAIDTSFCSYAVTLCSSLKRFDEALMWVAKGKSFLGRRIKETEALWQSMEDAEVNVLQRTGKYREAIEILQSRESKQLNSDSHYYLLCRSYYLLGELEAAEKYGCKAIEACADSMNHLQYAQVLYSMGRYTECIAVTDKAKEDVEVEWATQLSSYEHMKNHSALQENLVTEVYKLLIKASMKLGDPELAQIYLAAAKKIVPYAEIWQDIEDLWLEKTNSFEELLQSTEAKLKEAYPHIPDKAIWCIARAEAITQFVNAPNAWYDAICRDHGIAFEIILRNVVCKGSRNMHLEELIDYISGRPGDPLYGGNKLLHMLRRIRNNVSHEPIADANDAAFSRRILFDEVLAKL